MSENEYTATNGATIIVNGGDPLPGCPESWDEAYAWADKMNEGKTEEEPRWSFDCGFKLDFDGSILTISSRFYPPKNHYGPKWDGSVTVYFLEEKVENKYFECETLQELAEQSEAYVKDVQNRVRAIFPPKK